MAEGGQLHLEILILINFKHFLIIQGNVADMFFYSAPDPSFDFDSDPNVSVWYLLPTVPVH